jgi:hypothetical protein
MLLGPVAGDVAPLLEARLEVPDFEGRARWASFDGKLTPSLVAAAALMSVAPARTDALFEHLRVVLRSDLSSYGRPGTSRILGTRPHDLSTMLARQEEGIRERASRELCDILTENAARGAVHPAYELLGALGAPGIARGFELLDAHAGDPTSQAAYDTHLGILGATLYRAPLSEDQRVRAAALAKRALLAIKAQSGIERAELVAFVLVFGGDTEPELGAAAANERLLASAGGFLHAPLCQRTFELLRDRGVGRAVLEPKALGFVGHYNWTGQDGWLHRFVATLG